MATSRHKIVHHLSQKADEMYGAENGWVESVGDVANEHLLDEAEGMATLDTSRPTLNGTSETIGASEESFRSRLDQAMVQAHAELDSMGEAILAVGASSGWGPSPLKKEELDIVLDELTQEMDRASADVTVLRPRTDAAKGSSIDLLIRRRATDTPMEVRVAIIGNVDSGKSTLVGVLTRAMLDDGRGLARAKVFKHGHEESTGRTSSIGQHNLCLNSKGEILNDAMFRAASSADYVQRAAKVVTLVDLAGHERYFKTTAYGLTGHLPDYACLIISANNGLVGMCKEHLGVALALHVPVFFVVTKVDLCPEHIYRDTLERLQTILKKPGVRRKPFMVRNVEDTLTCARHAYTESLAPIFMVSSVTGNGLDLVRLFYNLLPQRTKWSDKAGLPVEFIIDETFEVKGVGTVVAGTLKQGVITTNSTLLLGPSPDNGTFNPATVKSIHYKRLPVAKVVAGQTAAVALKRMRREKGQVRKGMVLASPELHPEAVWEFDASISILTHSTTIQPRYQAVIHCEIIRQAARVVAMNSDLLRSGDRAIVRFRFLQRPEYLTAGTKFVFREGRTKGIGQVISRAYESVNVSAQPSAQTKS